MTVQGIHIHCGKIEKEILDGFSIDEKLLSMS